MCDRCSDIAAPTINALEALANGEPVPEVPAVPDGALSVAVPLMTGRMGPDQFVFVTNEQGYDLISRILRATGLMVPMSEDEF